MLSYLSKWKRTSARHSCRRARLNQNSRIRKYEFEQLEDRRLLAGIRPIVPPSISDPVYETKIAIDIPSGTTYELKKVQGHTMGLLTRCTSGACESINSVRNFELLNSELHVTFEDGSTAVTFLRGDVSPQLAAAAAAEVSVPPVEVGAIRGIVGRVGSEPELVAKYGTRLAPRTILDSVGRIELGNIFETPNARMTRGTGTVLEYGGNRFVLTAAHVVEDDSGRPRDPSHFTFVVQAGNPSNDVDAGEVFQVKEILGRSYFNQDLALLLLDKPVRGIQGAYLPSDGFGAQIGQQVLMVGYGVNNRGGTGERNFGYTDVEARPIVDRQVDSMRALGEHLEYKFDGGEAAFAKGDSGGPDFVPRRYGDIWIPTLVGVHSFFDAVTEDDVKPEEGASFYSVAVTQRVSELIRSAIPYTLESVIKFGLRVYDDGDDNISGCGEWRENFTVNGQSIDFILSDSICEDPNFIHWIAPRTLGTHRLVNVRFDGIEQDDGFFTGENETIPRYTGKIDIPETFLKPSYTGSSGQISGEVSYELFWEVSLQWVIANKTLSIPTVRGATSLSGALESNTATRSLWQNQSNRADINGDGVVAPLDALLTINRIHEMGSGLLRAVDNVSAVPAFLDANGDGHLTPGDALAVINTLIERALNENGAAESSENQFEDLNLATPIVLPASITGQLGFLVFEDEDDEDDLLQLIAEASVSTED